jgi:hypothetical protein
VGLRWHPFAGLELAKENVPRHTFIRKFAYLPDIDTADGYLDIWDLPTKDLYTYPADGTAPIDTVSSSSNSDTIPLLVSGLDINGRYVDQVITLTGQTKVTLPTPLWRAFRAFNNDSGTALVGNVYIYEDTVITAGVPDDSSKVRTYVAAEFDTGIPAQQTLMGHYTVPAGFNGYFMGIVISLSRAITTACQVLLQARDYGCSFRTVSTIELNSGGSSIFILDNPIPSVVSPNADIKFSANTSANNAAVSLQYWLALEKKDESQSQRGPFPGVNTIYGSVYD